VNGLAGSVATCACALAWSGIAHADLTRTFAAPVSDVRHAWALIADTSAAAADPGGTRAPYAANARYTAPGCVPGRVYWRRGGGPPPGCESAQFVDATPAAGTADAPAVRGLQCSAALANLASLGWHAAGRLRQWDPRALQWSPPSAGESGALECEDDRGRHGGAAGRWYAADGATQPWSADLDAEIAWDEHGTSYTLYAANYVAWWHGSTTAAAYSWREAQAEATGIAAGLHRGPLALVRHSWNAFGADDAAAEGGMVILAGTDGTGVAADAPALLRAARPGGGAPLAETLDEAVRLFRADAVRFGADSRASPSVPQPSIDAARSADRDRYASPVPASCSRAHVTMLGAGPPGQDGNVRARAWPDGAPAECDPGAAGHCVARYVSRLRAVDASPRPGHQDFDVDWRVDARGATPGGWLARLPGAPPRPTSVEALGPALADDARQRLHPGALARPSDAGPQLTALVARGADAFAALAVPATTARWSGGLRRVRLDPRTGAPRAPSDADQSRLPAPAERRLYTDLAGPVLTDPANRVAADNALLDGNALGLDEPDAAARAALLAWLRGADADDADADGDRTESRDAAGGTGVAGGAGTVGAVIGAPAVVRYPGDRLLVYAGTGDGILHAFDAALREAWAFMPAAFLARAAALRAAGAGDRRLAGIDGDLRVLAFDRDADGRIDERAGERAILLFGLRRGGRTYRALDVSDPDAPRVLWTLTPRELPGLAQTWAAPVPAKLTIAGARQNPERQVVLLAGGHDPSQDHGRARSRDRIGAALYLVDALTGALLWHAAGTATASPDLRVPGLDHGLAAPPRGVDLDGDGELDRAYVADTGGRVFRFEFTRGAPRRSLAQATLVAALGGTGISDRRFYAEPDVALVRRGPGAPYAAVTLGSGFAPDPTRRGVADRLYSLRDPLPSAHRAAPARPPVTDAELPDSTDASVSSSARGWKRRLTQPNEHVLGATRTIDHAAYVTTWTPPAATLGPDCVQPPGTNRLRVVDVRDGRPRAFRVIDTPDDGEPDSRRLPDGGAAPPLTVVRLPVPERCGADCRPRVAALLGLEPVITGWPGAVVRAGWAERGIE
jgi:type IV pilus assembly protein PilY1